jgi:formylglycine-generating enzyme required for sulfatase activity
VGNTSAVGSYPAGASPYGVLNMVGNEWEWVSDWYYSAYYSKSPSNNPLGLSSGEKRVVRGGSWYGNNNFVRVVTRYYFSPAFFYYNVGFRCAASQP